MATIASLVIDLSANVARLQKDMEQANRTVDRGVRDMKRSVQSLKATFEGILIGSGLLLFGKAMVREAMEAEQASNRLTAVLRATGGAAGLTKKELDDLADSMAASTQFDDESIRNAEAALLKFGNIHGDVFREGLKLSADLAAFMGTNVPEAAQMLGKSLQSPTEGLQMMERQFGKLTPAQEKHIETLVKQGRAMEAQNAVLDLWRQKIGGTADLMNTGLTKSTSEVKKAWNEMLESFERSGPVGDIVRDSLGGIRDILRDIAGLAEGQAADPLRNFNVALSKLEAEEAKLVPRLERADDMAQRRNSLASAAQAQQLRDRLAAIRAERQAIMREMRKTEEGVQVSGMDHPSTASVFAGVTLGGKGDEAELARRKKLAEDIAKDMREVDFALAKIRVGTHVAEQDGLVDVLEARKEASDRLVASMRETFDLQRRVLTGEISFIEDDPNARQGFQGAAQNWSAPWVSEIERVERAGKELGFAFESAFERAVIEGQGLRQVLDGISQDIARIILRKQVTQPLADAVQGIDFGALFRPEVADSGIDFRASGGPVMAGRPYVVGEEGPELFMPGASGAIVPNDAMGASVSIVQNIHVDSRSDLASVRQAMQVAKEQAKREIERSLRYGGSFARAAGSA